MRYVSSYFNLQPKSHSKLFLPGTRGNNFVWRPTETNQCLDNRNFSKVLFNNPSKGGSVSKYGILPQVWLAHGISDVSSGGSSLAFHDVVPFGSNRRKEGLKERKERRKEGKTQRGNKVMEQVSQNATLLYWYIWTRVSVCFKVSLDIWQEEKNILDWFQISPTSRFGTTRLMGTYWSRALEAGSEPFIKLS